MSVITGTNATFAIGTTAAVDFESGTQVDFEADSYQVVGEVSEIGEFGDERSIVEWISLNDGRVRKARGSANAGDTPITFGYDATDVGQAALQLAFEETSQAQDEFNFRIQLPDSQGVGGDGTTAYFRAKVSSVRFQGITPDGIITRQAMLAINTEVLVVEPESV